MLTSVKEAHRQAVDAWKTELEAGAYSRKNLHNARGT